MVIIASESVSRAGRQHEGREEQLGHEENNPQPEEKEVPQCQVPNIAATTTHHHELLDTDNTKELATIAAKTATAAQNDVHEPLQKDSVGLQVTIVSTSGPHTCYNLDGDRAGLESQLGHTADGDKNVNVRDQQSWPGEMVSP